MKAGSRGSRRTRRRAASMIGPVALLALGREPYSIDRTDFAAAATIRTYFAAAATSALPAPCQR